MKTKYYRFGDIELTHHDLLILSLLLQLSERWQMAEKLSITPGTLKQEIKLLYSKLRVHCLRDAIFWAFSHGFARNGNYRGKKII